VRDAVTNAFNALRADLGDPATNAIKALFALGDPASDRAVRFALTALGYIKQDDPKARDAVTNALITHLGDTNGDVGEAAAGALSRIGPLSASGTLTALRMKALSAAGDAGTWRAWAIAFSGAPGKPSDAWAYLMFLGGLGPGSIPWPGSAEKTSVAMPALRAIAYGWGTIQGSVALAQEASDAVLQLVSHACPEAATANDDPWWASAWRFLRFEAVATVATIERWLGLRAASEADGRCWTPDQYAILTKLRAEMAEMSATEPMAKVLSRRLQAERAPPVLGFVTTGALGWAVFWLGLILAFPFNARIRSAYLYNEKLRGLLSPWFVPLLLTLLPFLRKLLLLPFRDRLLADARLTDFDPTTWYPNVRVSDRRGTTRAITEALPHIRGNILLIGESGLGKTTFLRLLASQTHRTLVFLNARGCEKVGVPEAIRRKAGEVQGEEFFKSLIATRDLAVIIDALNEVNADIRANIVAFVNDFPKADILVATQPIESIGTDRSPFETARNFYLRPLADEDIARFLLSRPDRELPDRYRQEARVAAPAGAPARRRCRLSQWPRSARSACALLARIAAVAAVARSPADRSRLRP
jgi:hypothetical protein